MPFREKRAWISFVVIGLVSIVYYPMLVTAYMTADNHQPSFAYLHELAFAAIMAFIVLEILLHVGLRFITPEGERMPKDERERFIEARATQIAYLSLIVFGVMAAVLILHHPGSWSWFNANIAIFAIVMAEIVKYGMIIYQHRWGS